MTANFCVFILVLGADGNSYQQGNLHSAVNNETPEELCQVFAAEDVNDDIFSRLDSLVGEGRGNSQGRALDPPWDCQTKHKISPTLSSSYLATTSKDIKSVGFFFFEGGIWVSFLNLSTLVLVWFDFFFICVGILLFRLAPPVNMTVETMTPQYVTGLSY